MDEVLFRSSQKLENLQVQLSLSASHCKDIFQQYSQQSKSAILQAWHGPHSTQIKTSVKELWQYFLTLGREAQEKLWDLLDPEKLYYYLVKEFWKKWTKRDFCFMCAGFLCGSIAGALFAMSLKKRDRVIRYMQAVQCVNYLGIESATASADASAPSECGDDEVVIDVRAGSVHVVDAQICHGYGRALRRLLQRLQRSRRGLPVTLGRDCSGIVADVGANVARLEVGDEVWAAVPFWHEGTLAQSVLVEESRVGRKPKNIGFEAAASLPYAGSVALNALKEMDVTEENAPEKRFLVLGGCTPVGCVLLQVLSSWKGTVVASCSKRAVPVAKALGAADTVVFPEPNGAENAFLKELELKDRFDFVIVTEPSRLAEKDLQSICDGRIFATTAPERASDGCGFFGGLVLGIYVRLKYVFEKILGNPLTDFDEAHMCHVTLDELAEMVENGSLQTVVDKVYHPEDIEIALSHIQSYESIGSTVITFR